MLPLMDASMLSQRFLDQLGDPAAKDYNRLAQICRAEANRLWLSLPQRYWLDATFEYMVASVVSLAAVSRQAQYMNLRSGLVMDMEIDLYRRGHSRVSLDRARSR